MISPLRIACKVPPIALRRTLQDASQGLTEALESVPVLVPKTRKGLPEIWKGITYCRGAAFPLYALPLARNDPAVGKQIRLAHQTEKLFSTNPIPLACSKLQAQPRFLDRHPLVTESGGHTQYPLNIWLSPRARQPRPAAATGMWWGEQG